MLQRLVAHWVYGGALCGLLLLALAPGIVEGWTPAAAAAFLHLPAYMLHQYEEHDGDRFRLFFNQTLGGGLDVLSPAVVFLTNVPGVWGLLTLAVYAAHASPGGALLATWLVLVNAGVHIAHAIAFRRYNPGLASAVLVFLPLGLWTMLQVQRAGGGTPGWQALGLGVSIAIHAAIVVHVRRRAAQLRAGSNPTA